MIAFLQGSLRIGVAALIAGSPAWALPPKLTGKPCSAARLKQVVAQVTPKYGEFVTGNWIPLKKYFYLGLRTPNGPKMYAVRLDRTGTRIASVTLIPPGERLVFDSACTAETMGLPPGKYSVYTAGPKTAASIPAPGTTDQFDLLCTINWSSTDKTPNDPYPPTRRWSTTERYRLDLSSRRYCSGNCTSITAIQSVTAEMIALFDKGSYETGYEKINRIDGSYDMTVHAVGPGYDNRQSGAGKCTKAPFTPFPKPMF